MKSQQHVIISCVLFSKCIRIDIDRRVYITTKQNIKKKTTTTTTPLIYICCSNILYTWRIFKHTHKNAYYRRLWLSNASSNYVVQGHCTLAYINRYIQMPRARLFYVCARSSLSPSRIYTE